MSMKIALGRKEKRVYFDDDGRIVELRAGQTPPGGGSVFLLGPVPYNLKVEMGLSASGRNTGIAGESRVLGQIMADMMLEAIVGWEGVVDSDGADVEFVGKESLSLLPLDVLSKLIGHLFDEATKDSDAGNGPGSAGTPATNASGGSTTADRSTVSPATN